MDGLQHDVSARRQHSWHVRHKRHPQRHARLRFIRTSCFVVVSCEFNHSQYLSCTSSCRNFFQHMTPSFNSPPRQTRCPPCAASSTYSSPTQAFATDLIRDCSALTTCHLIFASQLCIMSSPASSTRHCCTPPQSTTFHPHSLHLCVYAHSIVSLRQNTSLQQLHLMRCNHTPLHH